MKKKFLLFIAMFYFTVSCGFNSDDRTAERDRQEQRDRELLKAAYENLNGFYFGSLKNNPDIEIVLLMETVSQSDGRDDSGKERFSIVLKGQAYIIDAMGSYPFTGTFYQQNQELVLVSTLTNTSFSLEDGHFDSNEKVITGLVRERGGELGEVELRQLSSQVKGIPKGRDAFDLDRAKCFLENIVGDYEGTVKGGLNRLSQIEAFSLTLSYNSQGQILGMFIPRKKDFSEVKGLRLPLNGKFSPRDGSLNLLTEHSNGRTSYVDGYIFDSYKMENLNIVYPAGLIGIGTGENVTRHDSIEACYLEKSCQQGDRLCKQSCERVCDDKKFLFKNLL